MKTGMNVHEILGRHMLVDGMDLVMDLDRSHGSWIVDQRDGTEYLDLYTMYASQAIGYNHPRMLEISDELARAATQKPICSDVYTVEMAGYMEVFERVAMPAYLPHAFFIEGGALAVENALKAAFDWKTRINLAFGKDDVRADMILHFKEAFHGRSGYTLSLTNTFNPDKTKYFPKFNWPRIDNPKLHFPVDLAEVQRVSETEARALDQTKQAIHQYGDRVAGLIIEPIQSEGGDNHFRPEFMQALRDLCSENRIIFILDEVQTGIGLTGRFWAHEHHSVVFLTIFRNTIYNGRNNAFHILLGGHQGISQNDSLKPAHDFKGLNGPAQVVVLFAADGVQGLHGHMGEVFILHLGKGHFR